MLVFSKLGHYGIFVSCASGTGKGTCTAACSGQMLPVIGAAVPASHGLSHFCYSISRGKLSFFCSPDSLLKLCSLTLKEKYRQGKEQECAINMFA